MAYCYATVILTSAALSDHQRTWFRASLSPTRRTTTQVMTTYVPDLSLHNLQTSTLSTSHDRWSCYLLAYKEGRSLTVPVLRCLETKEMQRVSVQCSGSQFPSLVPRVSFLDGYTICFCRQGLYYETHNPPVTDTVHATKQPCRGSPRHYISRVLQSPLPCYKEVRRLENSHRPLNSQLLPRDSSFHDGKCGKHSAISPSRRLGHFHRSCGCLFPYTLQQRLPKISLISDSGQNIPIPSTAVWPFSSTLGIHQDYDRDQNAGIRDGHQSMSVHGRLAHLFIISRPVPPRHCSISVTRWASWFTTRYWN